MISKPPCLAAALDYLERGWSALALCPPDHVGVGKHHAQTCGSPGKVPLGPWAVYQKRLPKPDEIEAQWNQQPNANLGVVLGAVSGMVGIDVDGKKGEELLHQIAAGNLPDTLEFTTPGGGRRLLYAVPKGHPLPITKIAGEKHQELRLLANGSQTVAPPSRHKSGGVYEWADGKSPAERKIAAAPPWLLKRLALKAAQAAHGINGVTGTNGVHVTPSNTIPEGQRDVTLTSMAGAMRRRGVSEDGIYAALSVENKRCVPPLPDAQVRKIAKSVGKYQPYQINAQTMARVAQVLCLEGVQVKDVQWLWKPWIPLGKPTILDGDPGLGKSTVLLDIAARVSRGWEMPDGSPGVKAPVVLLSAEDDLEDTVKPRLLAAEADLTQIHAIDHVKENGTERPVALPHDVALVESEIVKHGARLLVIDPLMAFLRGVDSCNDQEVRQALFPIARMSQRTGAAVVMQRHLNKSSVTKAMYRGGGSIAIIAAARSAILIAQDPDNATRRIMAHIKCNLAAPPTSLCFALQPTPNAVCRVHWCGESLHTADKLVGPPVPEDDKSALAEAVNALAVMLEDGPKPADVCFQEGQTLGISKRTLERAKVKLGVKAKRVNTEHGPRWFWTLPGEA